MAQLAAGAYIRVANFAALPSHIAGVSQVRITVDTNTVYISDGVTWTAVAGDSSGNVDGGNASTVYGGSNSIDGGGAT